MDAGLLPNLAALRSQGSYMPLASTVPHSTFPAWTTCVTGVNPGKHGVFDFTEVVRDGRGHSLRFVNSTYRGAPAIWNVLSQAGARVCVLGVPATYPPEQVNGIMVSGFDSPVCGEVDRSFVYPQALYEEVRGWRYVDVEETRVQAGWHERALPRLLHKVEDKSEIARRLLSRERWDFMMVVFGETDAAAHHFWHFHDEQSPRHMPGLPDAILQVYTRLDAAVGRLIEAVGPDVIVGVVSDHGSGGAGTGVLHLNNWLCEHGHLTFRGAQTGRLKQATLSLTPQRVRGAIFRRMSGLAAKAEASSRFAGIDMARTRAWSEELNYFPSIRVNVQPSEYEKYCDGLCRELETWEAIKKAWRREELFEGAFVKRAPDVVLELELENGYSYSCLRSRGGASFRRLEPSEYYGAKGAALAGNHRPHGVFFASEKVPAASARIQDVAPTVLAAMGVAAPPMDGTPLWGVLPGAGPCELAQARADYDAQQERLIEERLRALGYLE
jgi:predicted AlkP superfamily phosphohydrolase/phosphomutase